MTLVQDGPRLVELAAAAGAQARLFGGVAIWYRSTEETRERLGREYADIDLVAHRDTSRKLRDALESAGYEAERTFNAAHGARRLLYHAADGSYHIDVFLDRFEMSHNLDFTERLELEPLTLTAADLLLAKLQVAEINEKDLRDTTMLLLDHELSDTDGDGVLDATHVARLCAADWGLFTTVGDNLERLRALVPDVGLDDATTARAIAQEAQLRETLESEPKTRAWKLRARVGRRKRWYEVPEEVHR